MLFTTKLLLLYFGSFSVLCREESKVSDIILVSEIMSVSVAGIGGGKRGLSLSLNFCLVLKLNLFSFNFFLIINGVRFATSSGHIPCILKNLSVELDF